MSDPASSPAVAPAAAAQVHQAIRRGSVLKAVPKPAEAGLSSEAINAYNQTVTAGKNEESLIKELAAKRGSIVLKSVPSTGPSKDELLKQLYLEEQAHEAEVLTENSKILHQLRIQQEADIPPPPPAEEDSSSLPPPPSTAPPADFVHEVANPKLKLALTPVNNPKLIHDGLNPSIATLAAIEKKDLTSTLKPVATTEKNFFASTVFKGQYAAEEAALNQALRRNSVLMDQLKLNAPPPAYPYSAEELAEAAAAKKQEEQLLATTPVAEENTPAAAAAAPVVERVRRNSKMAFLGDLTKPLARVNLNPVIPEEKTPLQRYEEEKAAEAATSSSSAAVASQQ